MRRELSPADVRAYVERDWAAVREAKRAYWRDRSKRAGLSELLAVAEQMRIPSTEQAREADLKTHARVAAILAKTACAPSARASATRRLRGRARRTG